MWFSFLKVICAFAEIFCRWFFWTALRVILGGEASEELSGKVSWNFTIDGFEYFIEVGKGKLIFTSVL